MGYNKRNYQEYNPVIQKIRNDLIDNTLKLSNNITQKKNKNHIVLKENDNFAAIFEGKNRFCINVISKALSQEELDQCTVYPKEFKWALDCKFVIICKQDYKIALNMLKKSREYRLNNPRRKRKDDSNEKS